MLLLRIHQITAVMVSAESSILYILKSFQSGEMINTADLQLTGLIARHPHPFILRIPGSQPGM